MSRASARSTRALLPVIAASALAAVLTEAPFTATGQRTGTRMKRSPVAWVPGGWFRQGSGDRAIHRALVLCLYHRDATLPGDCAEQLFEHEQPRRRVWVSAYGIDRHEVTNAEWRRCVAAGVCPPSRLPDGDARMSRSEHPVAGIRWREAARYCRFVGGRLPTEAEWERAARGNTPRRFPWGDVYNDRLANHGRSGGRPGDADGYRYAAPVGSYPAATSPFGLLDAAGNVWEWTADRYQPDSYRNDSRIDPEGAARGSERVIRGGSWRSAPHTLRTAHRGHRPETGAWPDVGVRCAYDRR